MLPIVMDILPALLKDLPYATLFLFGLSALISLLTTLANRRLTNPEQAKTVRKEVGEWNKELREAQRNKDKKTVDKLMKKQQYMMQLQSKMMWQSMKVSLLFLIPLLLMWQLLGQFFAGKPVAIFPGAGPVLPIPIFSGSLLWWYLLCSLLCGTAFSHLFGLTEVSE
ncbi:MAG TPA: EMC3/TMCO1 family protein [Candidatus Eisenbacteria bacterium]|nr:EMC3/TMCO1 family protein [Candidatus Eisenbacteria bacterium]